MALFAVYTGLTWLSRDERQTMILAACMAVAAVFVFVVVLGQAMPTYTADYFSAATSKIGSIFKGVKG